MTPQINFDFGPTSFDRAYQLSLPLIPGGLFVGGLLMAHPGLALSARNALGLGESAAFVALAFVAYAFGFVLFARQRTFDRDRIGDHPRISFSLVEADRLELATLSASGVASSGNGISG